MSPLLASKLASRADGTWSIADEFDLPDLDDVFDGGRVDHDTLTLFTTLYDTANHDLRRHGVVVCRETGDDAPGWWLSAPGAEASIELHWPLSARPPAELVNLIAGLTLGAPVDSVSTIRVRRDRYLVTGGDNGRVEVSDDRVRASSGERLLAWRELGVDTDDSAPSAQARLAKRLRAAGACPAPPPGKLARFYAPPPRPDMSPAATAVTEYLHDQIGRIVAGDIGLRRGQDPIHDTRVAIRRLRSTLRVCGSLMDTSEIAGIDDDLRWFAGLLGTVRDCQVQQRRFTSTLDSWRDELVLGPVRSRIRNELSSIELPARAAVAEAMDSPRYLAMIKALAAWRLHPPVDFGAGDKALRKQARRARRKADNRLAHGLRAGDDATLHRARKAAKRARYAAELIRAADDTRADDAKPLGRHVKRYKKVQRVLGDHQDAAVAAEVLLRLAKSAGTAPGENGFTFGLLYAHEQRVARAARRAACALR